jgi:hypothetical protein
VRELLTFSMLVALGGADAQVHADVMLRGPFDSDQRADYRPRMVGSPGR